MRRAHLVLGGLFLASVALDAVGCSQTPVVVPLRSMERPKDMDYVCLWHVSLNPDTWRGVPLNRCHVDINSNPAPLQEDLTVDPNAATHEYRLHAVVTQVARGELAVVDLGTNPNDPGQTLLKLDPRLPSYTFLPVGAVPKDVVADPQGKAIYVASGHDRRVDVVPAEMLRGPIDTTLEQFGSTLPWPHLDFGDADGAPTRLATYDDGTNDRLYVVLPDAKDGPKVAVYDIGCPSAGGLGDLCPTALLPQHVGDIPLTLSAATKITPTTLNCNGTPTGDPWWNAYQTACFPGQPPPTTVREPEAPFPPVQPHIGGVAVANGLLFAADDGAPFIHVFDISGGRGAEIQRIDVGSKISQLAVSAPVPDEATFKNANAIEVCEVNDWVGDRTAHNESDLVRTELGGFCRAHRYIYAIDYEDTLLGNGSIAVIDVPVFLDRDPAAPPYNPANPMRRKIVAESLDFGSISLAQPMGCDSPAFASTRIPIGNFAIGGQANIPARAVTFVNYDPPSPNALLYGLRCRSWGHNPVQDSTLEFPTALGASSIEYDVLPPGVDRNAVINEQNAWENNVGPRRMRGTFAFVAMSSGGVGIIDVDDWDSLCRGPSSNDDINVADLTYPTQPDSQRPTYLQTPNSTHEYTYEAVRRHHPRSERLFDVNNVPGVTSILLTTTLPAYPNATSLAWGVQAGDRVNPHFVPLVTPGGTAPSLTSLQTTDFIKTSATSPFGYTQENWTLTYQGALPGFGGSGASIEIDTATVRDPGGSFCERGTEAFDPTFAHNDVVQIIDAVCEDATTPAKDTTSRSQCTSGLTHAQCLAEFGGSDPTLGLLMPTRDLVIGQAFDQHVTIAQHFEIGADGTPTAKPGLPAHLKECFPGLVRYVVRARDTWVVNGTETGYLHRVIVDPKATTPDAPCMLDPNKPMIFEGRVQEIPAPGTKDTAVPTLKLSDVADVCPGSTRRLFVNPQWEFAIQTGYDANGNAIPTTRDTTFTFGARYDFLPLTVPGASMPVSIRALQQWKNGTDILGWNMISVVDAIDKGFALFFVGDTTNSKVFE